MLCFKEKYRFLDVGGTFIKCADGRQVPILSEGTKEEIASALQEAIGPAEGLKGVGIAIPGPFNYAEGIFLMKHKFHSVYSIPFRELVNIPEHVDLKFNHDVVAQHRGAFRMLSLEKENTAVVTLGTGLGFSVSIGGEIILNEMGSPAKSLWNIPLDDGGILEDRVSSRGICAAYFKKTGVEIQSVHSIAEQAQSGEEAAMEVFSEVGDLLGGVLEKITRDLEINTLLMGGQISKSFTLFSHPLEKHLERIHILPVPEGAVFQGLLTLFDNLTIV